MAELNWTECSSSGIEAWCQVGRYNIVSTYNTPFKKSVGESDFFIIFNNDILAIGGFIEGAKAFCEGHRVRYIDKIAREAGYVKYEFDGFKMLRSLDE